VRAAVILLNAHQARLMATPACRPLLSKLQRSLRTCVQSMKNLMGFNLAGLHHVQALAKSRTAAPEATNPIKRLLDVTN
jgi:Dip2/Utp12 Family